MIKKSSIAELTEDMSKTDFPWVNVEDGVIYIGTLEGLYRIGHFSHITKEEKVVAYDTIPPNYGY